MRHQFVFGHAPGNLPPERVGEHDRHPDAADQHRRVHQSHGDARDGSVIVHGDHHLLPAAIHQQAAAGQRQHIRGKAANTLARFIQAIDQGGDTEVRMIRIDGLGHTWTKTEVDTTGVMWQFFKSHKR